MDVTCKMHVLLQLQRGMRDSIIVAELPASQEDALQQVSEMRTMNPPFQIYLSYGH